MSSNKMCLLTWNLYAIYKKQLSAASFHGMLQKEDTKREAGNLAPLPAPPVTSCAMVAVTSPPRAIVFSFKT